MDAQSIVANLEGERAEVIAGAQVGCFTHDWQALSNQVRLMIVKGPRHLAIKDNRKARQQNLRLAESPPAVHSKGVDPKRRALDRCGAHCVASPRAMAILSCLC